MGIEERFEDFSEWPEHLRPVKLDRVPSTPEEAVWMVMKKTGSEVKTAAIQNTMKAYGIEGGFRPSIGEEEKAARIVYKFYEGGIHAVHKGQATVILYNVASKYIEEESIQAVVEGFYKGRTEMDIRELFEKAGLPQQRMLSGNFDINKIERLVSKVKDTPVELKRGDLLKHYIVTRRSIAPARSKKSSPDYIEALKVNY